MGRDVNHDHFVREVRNIGRCDESERWEKLAQGGVWQGANDERSDPRHRSEKLGGPREEIQYMLCCGGMGLTGIIWSRPTTWQYTLRKGFSPHLPPYLF